MERFVGAPRNPTKLIIVVNVTILLAGWLSIAEGVPLVVAIPVGLLLAAAEVWVFVSDMRSRRPAPSTRVG